MSDNKSQKLGLSTPRNRDKGADQDKLDTVGQRVKHARLSLNRTQSDFIAGLPGMTNKILSNVESGQTRPSMELVTYMMDHWFISPSWVLANKGPMLLPDDGSDLDFGQRGGMPSMRLNNVVAEENTSTLQKPVSEPKIVAVTVDVIGNEVITQVGKQARASYINAIATQEPQQLTDLPTISLPGPRWRHGTYRAFEVSGDSMQTTLHPGDIVIAERLYHWPTDIREGCVHVIVTHDDLVVKRVTNRLIETEQLVLHSDNVQYSEQVVDGNEVLEVWLCKAYISYDFTNSRYDAARELADTQADVAILTDEVQMMRQAIEQLTGAPLKRSKPKKK